MKDADIASAGDIAQQRAQTQVRTGLIREALRAPPMGAMPGKPNGAAPSAGGGPALPPMSPGGPE